MSIYNSIHMTFRTAKRRKSYVWYQLIIKLFDKSPNSITVPHGKCLGTPYFSLCPVSATYVPFEEQSVTS